MVRGIYYSVEFYLHLSLPINFNMAYNRKKYNLNFIPLRSLIREDCYQCGIKPSTAVFAGYFA
jgi:hypothetical protein